MSHRTDTLRAAASHYLPRPLPAGLEVLSELALDMRWSWNHEADQLWERVDPELWEAAGNPWLILQSLSLARLEQLASDKSFLAELHRLREARENYLRGRPWFKAAHGGNSLKMVAYFSMEFGLSEALPIYAGGLGILAGDHLKTASDLGVPLCGVGLLYQQGYFRQAIGSDGSQVAVFPYNNPAMLPIAPVRDASGEWLHVVIELPGRKLYLRGWQVTVGRAMLYLLDSNDPLNRPVDRGITGELYSGGAETRLLQELALGIGGWRLLRELGLDCEVCHLNEGHAAFAVLERARDFMLRAGCSFAVALRCTRAGNVFTTHTPVAAGFDRFAPELLSSYLRDYAGKLQINIESLLALGRSDERNEREPFNMAYLAMRGCGSANAVSELHRHVSQRIFQPLFPRQAEVQVPIGHVTNGVHVPSWDSAAADAFWTENCGKGRWIGTLEEIERAVSRASDEAIWTLRTDNRRVLVDAVRRRIVRQQMRFIDGGIAGPLDYNILTLGFARRFTGYKRPNLLLCDHERLTRILTKPSHPAQLVIAGKAHPADVEGQRFVREWIEYGSQSAVRGRVIFLEDYDLALAAELVQGVDLWINTPRRPWEACGTSGMKLLVNGGLNLSELDGWWAEAYTPEAGWALGDRQEHDDAPGWDAHEAHELYRILENEVIPTFYLRDERGVPSKWVARIRTSMGRLAPRFSSNRMMREYTEQCYLEAARRFHRRAASNGALADELERWHNALQSHWPEVRFGNRYDQDGAGKSTVRVQLYLGGVDRDAVAVELYAEGLGGADPVRVPMAPDGAIAGAVNGWIYQARIGSERPFDHYTPRALPRHGEALVPLEAGEILWFR